MANKVWEDFKKRFNDSYVEGFKKIPDSSQAILESYRNTSLFKKSLVTGIAGSVLAVTMWPAVLMGSTSAIVIQLLGFGGFALSLLGSQNKDNRHSNALYSVSLTVIAGQCFANGDIPGTTMVAHGAIFTGLCALIPDEGYVKTRNTMTVGLGVGGAVLAGAFLWAAGGNHLQGMPTVLQNTVNAIPVVTVLANAYAFSRPDAQSARAKLTFLFCNLAHLTYFATRDNPSAAIILSEMMFLASHPVAIYRFHMVKKDFEGNTLPLSRRLSIFFKNTILNNEPSSAHGLTPDDISKKAAAAAAAVPEAPHIS